MKTAIVCGFMFMATFAAHATPFQQLFLDAGGGTTATIDVDALGFLVCTGSCGGLVIPSSIPLHTTLRVYGTLGQFDIAVTGVAGASAIVPTLQNLNLTIAARNGAGSLFARFTDTYYCQGGGGCFGVRFVMAAATVNDPGISNSTTDFSSFASSTNLVPANSFIGGLSGLTGLAGSAANSFANTIDGGASLIGSLTGTALIHFSGAGRVQASLQISATNTILPTNVPANKDQCINGGWATLHRVDGSSFKNQGDCIQYVNTGK